MESVKLFKLFSKAADLNEIIVMSINHYCLSFMSNNELEFSKWSIGMTNDDKISCDRKWECASDKEANDTKRFFTEYKSMKSINGEGRFIYVNKINH